MGYFDDYSDGSQAAAKKEDDSSFFTRIKKAIGITPEKPPQGRTLSVVPATTDRETQEQPPANKVSLPPQPPSPAVQTKGSSPVSVSGSDETGTGPLSRAASRLIPTTSIQALPAGSSKDRELSLYPSTFYSAEHGGLPSIQGTVQAAKDISKLLMGAGIVTGLATNPITTATALGTFFGIDEAKNAVISKIKKEPYKFQGGKGVADLFEAEGLSRDAIELGEFVLEGMAAGGATKTGKSIIGDIVGRIKGKEAKVEAINTIVEDAKTQGISTEQAAANYAERLRADREAKKGKGPGESTALGSRVEKKGSVVTGKNTADKTIVTNEKPAWAKSLFEDYAEEEAKVPDVVSKNATVDEAIALGKSPLDELYSKETRDLEQPPETAMDYIRQAMSDDMYVPQPVVDEYVSRGGQIPEGSKYEASIRPAVKTEEGLVEGDVGSTHPETMKAEDIPATEGHERGFTRGDGEFMTRDQAKADLKEKEPDVHAAWENIIKERGGSVEEAELHSEDLNEARRRVEYAKESQAAIEDNEEVKAQEAGRPEASTPPTPEKTPVSAPASAKEPWEMRSVELSNKNAEGVFPLKSKVEVKNGKPVYTYSTTVQFGNEEKTFSIESRSQPNATTMVERLHKKIVEQALSEGKKVPADVLAEYPELQKEQGKEGKADETRPEAKPEGGKNTWEMTQAEYLSSPEKLSTEGATYKFFPESTKELKKGEYQTAKLSEVLNFPALFDKFPELKDLKVVKKDLGPNVNAEHWPNEIWINEKNSHKWSSYDTPEQVAFLKADDAAENLATILHELQHELLDMERGYSEVSGKSHKRFEDYYNDPSEVAARDTKEYLTVPRTIEGHRSAIKQALLAGESVPRKVLAEYPDLPNPSRSPGEGEQKTATPSELFNTSKTFSLAGNQPVKQTKFEAPEVRGERLIESEKQSVDEIYDRLKQAPGSKMPGGEYTLQEARGNADARLSQPITDRGRVEKVASTISTTIGRQIAPKDLDLWERSDVDDLGKLAGLFQKKIVVFQVKGKGVPELPGYFNPLESDAIYLNVNAPNPHLTVLGHELLHSLRHDASKIYDQFINYVQRDEPTFDVHKAGAEEFYGRKITEDEAMEEYAADYIGGKFVDPSFWERFAEKKPAIFERVTEALHRMVNALSGLRFKTDIFFRDAAKAEDAAAKAMSKYASRQAEISRTKIIASDPSGFVTMDLLMPGATTAIEKGRTLTEGARKIKGQVETLILPTDKSPEHLAAGELLGSKLGTLHRDAETAAATLRADGKWFIKQGVHNPKTALTDNAGVKFMSDMSQGRPLTARMKEIGDRVERLFAGRLKKLEEAGAPLETTRENYFPGMWTNESRRAFNRAVGEIKEMDAALEDKELADWTKGERKQVADRVKELMKEGEGSDRDALQYLAKRPFKGKESFRKQKAFDDIMTGVEFGLEPISPNPIDLVMLKLSEMDRSIMANSALKDWKTKGDVKFLASGRMRPAGWQEVKDKYGTVYGPPEMMTSEYVSQTQYDALDQTLKNLGIRHERKPSLGGNALGKSYTGGSRIETQANTELSVMAHEIGHQLGDKYNLWDQIVTKAEGKGKKGEVTKSASAKKRAEVQDELRAIADLRWEGQKPSQHFKDYTRKQPEKIAQMVEAYVQMPERFTEVAPNVSEAFEGFLKSIPELQPLADIQGGISYKELTTKRNIGGFPVIGHWIAKDAVGDVLNNYLSSSLYNSPYFGTLYKGWMKSANMLNQFQLGVGSAFHVGFTSMDVQISAGANVMKDSYGLLRGNRSVGDLGRSVGRFTTAMISTPKAGGHVLEEWRRPSMDIPIDKPLSELPADNKSRIGMIAKAAELAGGAFKMEKGLQTEVSEKMLENWHTGAKGKAKAVVDAPFALVELGAGPIMNWLVPRQKAGVFGDLAGRIIKQNPGKTLADLTPQFRQAWNRVDARLGQVVYDRLFMNNITKNVMQALIRAPGWTGGTIAEIGGAPKDFTGFFKEWAQTGKMPENIPDRVAYTVSLLTLATITNGLLTYAFTGDKPAGMDFWAFRTGGKDEYGREERFVLPTYAKDLFAYYEDIGHTVLAKTHPLIGLIGDIYRNRDYYGVKVRNEDDPIWQQVADSAVFTGKQYIPFWMRGASKETERGGGFMKTLEESPSKILAPQLGVMPATAAYTMSKFEKKARAIQRDERPLGTRTKEAGEKSDLKRSIEMKLRREDISAEDDINDAISEGTLTRGEAAAIRKKASTDPMEALGKSLTLDQLARTIPYATDEEKETLMPIFRRKYYSKTGKGTLSQKDQEKMERIMEENE